MEGKSEKVESDQPVVDDDRESSIHEASVSMVPPATVQRRLKARHIQFIAIGGTIGTGLFLGIGKALAQAGPFSLFIGYLFTGVAVYAMMQCLGEMTTWLPLPGAIGQLSARFVDESLGFAVGWNQWYNLSIGVCAEISAAVALIAYWNDSISPAVWITIILVVIVILNVCPVHYYGEAEFLFACIKIITLLGLLTVTLVLMLGGGPNHDRIGFRYWKSPGAMNPFIASGAGGRFLGLFSVLINAAFAYGGIEQLAMAAGEVKDPTKAVPKAIRQVFWRIALFYILGALAVGILVPSNDPDLLTGSGIAASPWVIAIPNAGVPILPSIINAVIITSAASAANAQIYTGSRYLYALAVRGQAPQIFAKCTKQGVPVYSVALTSSVGLLTYMTVSTGGSQVFQWFSNLVAIAYLITWTVICYTYIRFRKAMDHNGVDRSTQDFVAPFTPYLAWFGVVFFSMVIFFNGFAVFTHGNWNVQNFVTAYIGIPIFAALYLGWKLFKKDKLLAVSEVDLFSGREHFQSMEESV